MLFSIILLWLIRLTHNYPEWEELQPDFHYHGRNAYAYLLHFFGGTLLVASSTDSESHPRTTEDEQRADEYSSPRSLSEVVPTFDFVSIQLYESYSHAVYNTTVPSPPQSRVDYLVDFVDMVLHGWEVQLPATVPQASSAATLNDADGNSATTVVRIQIAPTQLVIGLANGWADGVKALLLWPEEAGAAYRILQERSRGTGENTPVVSDGMPARGERMSGGVPRGFMFWDIADEGAVVAGTDKQMWMAKGLNRFMHTRLRPLPDAWNDDADNSLAH